IERFDCVMVGTVTKDGRPRVNPVEAYILDGHLLMNMMAGSLKAVDLLRDPRIFVHTLVTSKAGTEGEFKIVGHARLLENEPLLVSFADFLEHKINWRPPPESHSFDVAVERVAFVRYDPDGTQHIRRWPDRRSRT
ncbi:MAG TPA: pyridoxamine 5'-phosphate oxidase family protein, partial [Gaiellaceae bacterium]|nr:pyridoxamine 5'-phosphate oxidase family protein [Gaiellaceae bacterium]